MIDKNCLQDAVVCDTADSVLEVARILRDTQKRHLVVVDENQKPLGLISTVDINNRVVSEEKDPKATKASDIMTESIETVEISEGYGEAYQKMIEKNTYSIPVVENGKLVGMLGFDQMFTRLQETK